MAIDISRKTSGVVLPEVVSSEIMAKVLESSAVMQLARRIEMPGPGIKVQTITGEPTAAWVGETEQKPVSRHTLGTKTLAPYTIAVIEPFSNQFRRDKVALYNELIRRLPYALAKTFDSTVFGEVAKPGSDFDQMSDLTAVNIKTDPWTGLVAADAAVSANGHMINGYAISPQAKSILLGAKDGNQRPLFINSVAEGSIPVLLGNPVHVVKAAYLAGTADGPNAIGYTGDWTKAVYGTVEGVQIAISDQATLIDGENTINLFQQNMFAVRAEIELGFRLTDATAFVKLTDKDA